MKVFAVWLFMVALAGCAGQEGVMAREQGITTYGVIDVGISNR